MYPLTETSYPKITVIALSVSGETIGIIEAIRKSEESKNKNILLLEVKQDVFYLT